MFNKFNALHKKLMHGLITESKWDKPTESIPDNAITNSFGVGFDFSKAVTTLNPSAEPLSLDYEKILNKGKGLKNVLFDVPLYCKPEKNSNVLPSTLGDAVVFWLRKFDYICDGFMEQMGNDDINTTAQAGINFRHTQVYGLMLDLMFNNGEYQPMPHVYEYYRIDLKALDKALNGKLSNRGTSLQERKALANEINAIEVSEEWPSTSPIFKFPITQIIRKSDEVFTQRRAKSTTLDERICVDSAEFGALQNLMNMSISEVNFNIFAKCAAHNDGTPIKTSHPQFKTVSDAVASRFGEDKLIAVGTDGDFEIYEGFTDCIKMSDLIECIRDTSQYQNPKYKPKSLKSLGVNNLFRNENGKSFIFVYLWDEKRGVGKAKKLFYKRS